MQCCPNCGVNLSRFDALTYGNVTINEAKEIIYGGQVVNMPPSSKMMVEALIRAAGRTMTRDALANVLDFEGDIYAPGNALTVYIVRARKAFRDIQIANGHAPDFDQIKIERGIGYRWEKRAAVELAQAA